MKNGYCSGSGQDVPPALEHVLIYFAGQNKPASEAREFYRWYQDSGWLNPAGVRVGNWKQLAWNWIWYKNKSRLSGKIPGNK